MPQKEQTSSDNGRGCKEKTPTEEEGNKATGTLREKGVWKQCAESWSLSKKGPVFMKKGILLDQHIRGRWEIQ